MSRIQQWGRDAYSMKVGDLLRRLNSIIVGVIPVFLAVVSLMPSYQLIHPEMWLIAWTVLFLGKELINAYTRGLRREAEGRRLNAVHRSLAATVDRITRTLVASQTRSLDVKAAETIIIGLLARMKDYAKLIFAEAESAGLRVTLAIPWDNPQDSTHKYLRIWCYDQPDSHSNWTSLPLPQGEEVGLPGMPQAFVTGWMQIIEDVTKIPAPNRFRGQYRSVLSLPVGVSGPSGATIAVVNIDARPTGFFNNESVDEELYDKVKPALSLLALVLLLLEPGGKHEFGN